MKRKSFKLLLLLPLIVFLVSGCKKRISIDTINSAVMTEEICLKACGEMEDKAVVELENCLVQCTEKFTADLNDCPDGQIATLCLTRAVATFTLCKAACFKVYRAKLEEVNKCRKDCRDKFRQMMMIDPN